MDAPALYADMIEQIGKFTGAPYSLIHVHVGMIIYLGAVLILRRPFRSPLPLLVVMLAEFGNETMDRLHWGSWRWADTSADIANTLVWPLVIFLIAAASEKRRNRGI